MKNNSIKRKKVTFLNKKGNEETVKTYNDQQNDEIDESPQEEEEVDETEEQDRTEISQVNNKVEKKRKITTITTKKDSDSNFRRVHYWDLWKYIYNPWDADIIKRLGGEKKDSNKLLKYKRIKQIVMKRIELIDEGYVTMTGPTCPTNLIKLFCKERDFNDLETEIIAVVMIGDKNSVLTFKYLIELIDKLIQDEISKTQE